MTSGFPKKTPTPHLLSREMLKSLTLLPSKFLGEKFVSMKTSTGGSILPKIGPSRDMRGLHQKLTSAPRKESLIQVSPPEMVLQHFVTHEASEMVVSLTNKGKFPQLVKMYMESSPHFQLMGPNNVYRVVTPGVPTHVRIRFTPDENKDYFHQLVCTTARERIVVPIQAIGARAILDFPDQLDFPACPVKYSSQKTLLVRNVSNQAARYQLSTQSPFSVVPTTGILGAGDSMQVTVRFHPLKTGDHSGSLVVCCNTGLESIHTNLHGQAVDLNIALSTNSVDVDKTFIGMSNHTTVLIENRSNITAHFQWKAFPTEEYENEEKRRQYLLRRRKAVCLETFMEKRKMEKGSCKDHTSLLRNVVQEEMAKMQEDPLLFSSDIFCIEPMEGEIGPYSLAEIKVTFKPLEAQEYQRMAYCNISGRESRLPLHLRGEGQGPLVEFSSPSLNLGNIPINTPHICEVKLINQGAINAPFTYSPSTAKVGFFFKFAPKEGIITPGGIQTIQISFSPTVLGTFEEELQFSVAGSPVPAILTIKGNVTQPTLRFDLDELSFGDISFGFPCTQSCRLTNTSPVPVTFKLRMSDDGTQPAVNVFDQIRSDSDPSWREGIRFYVEPREFTMNPSQGTILPQGHQDIEVTLCSNTMMNYHRKMLVDLEGVGKGVASLVITARCCIPELYVYPQILLYDECQLKVPYQRKFLIANNTDLPGCYGLIPQERKEDSPVFYSSHKPCGIVQPHSIAEIPVTIEVQRLGKHDTDVFIGVFGDERNPLPAELRSSGQLAKIYPSPRLIEFGRIPALQPTSRSFTLFNKDFIPRDFRIEIPRKPHCYAVEPREGVIPAWGEVPVTVTATLDDTGLFASVIQLFIGDSLWTACGLVALGTGTTIVIDKPFAPELNLGYQFSHVPCIHRFKVTNRGHHFHQLFWSVGCYSPPAEGGQGISALSSPKDDSQSPKRAAPMFALEPPLMKLQPGESVDMVLRGFSCVAQEVQDYVMCEAVRGIAGRKEKIIETVLTCKYIDPSIEISARQFSFHVEKKPSDVLTRQYQPLALKNTCLLPLDLMLDVEQPFLVCDEDQLPLPDDQPVTVDVGETCHLYIAFDPAYELDFKSWKKEKVLKIGMVRGYPFVEHITLRGEVHFPNLQIQPSTLEFGCIMAGTEEVRSLEITNCSPLPVKYHWSFHSDNQVNKLRSELYLPKFKPQPPKEKRTHMDSLASQMRRFKIRNVEEADIALKESRDLAQSVGAEVPPQTRAGYYTPLGLTGFRCSRDVPHTPLEAEEAFSIVPVSGVLQPGGSQQVSFTFFGHLNAISNVTALCHVEGGPTYEVMVTGEASRVSYSLSLREINCGSQIFNEIGHSTVTLVNTGKIEFIWMLKPSTAAQHLPGVFLVNPTTGFLAPGEKQVLKFSYVPGLPGAFSRTYQLKVGDLDPENILLKGEASCPMISMNLPWNIIGNIKPEKPLKQLVKPLHQYGQRSKSAVRRKSQTLTTQTLKTLNPKPRDRKPRLLGSGTVPSSQLQTDTIRTLIEKADLELQQKLTCYPPNSRFPDKELCQSLVKVELPEYVLDMGPVHKGYTERSTLEITNPGQIPVSFQVDVSVLLDTGFSVNLDQVRGLPPSHTVVLEVRFESAHQPQGDVDVLLPIEVTKGPTYNIRLHATVSELSLELSNNRLHFSDTLIGQCKAETIHLRNWFRLPCKWFITATKPVPKIPAVHQKQQVLEDEPCPFEVKPSKGTLGAGRSRKLQIRFTPKEERSYRNELEFNICGSSNHLKLHLSGQGLEPRLEFNPPALKMGWVLVDSDGVEATAVVRNPCSFPIEFYSLDFDKQYLEEEKIRRMAVGSKYQKSFLMPPCAVGKTLPPEVLEDHETEKRTKAQQAELKAMTETKARTEAEAEAKGKAAPAHHRTLTFCPESTVKGTGSPVSRAVMHHLGIDASSERREVQQPRGIVVIIHGPPRAGKTEIAAGLCQYYDAAYVSIDTVVKEAMANDGSPAGLSARELCTDAAMEPKGKDKGKKPHLTAQTKNKQAPGEKINKKVSRGKNPPAQKKVEPASKPNIKDTKFTVSTAPAPQQLNIISSGGEELNCLSCVLPEDLLVDILSERLKCKDCYKGVVFDGLETLFASSLESSLLCVLRAVKNCHHIYIVNLNQDYASWKAKEEAKRKRKKAGREKEELQQKKAIKGNKEHVLQMDEDEYDTLTEEKKAEVDKIILEMKTIQTEGEVKELAQKLEEEAKDLGEEERQKEEEKQKENKGVSVGKQPEKPQKEAKPPEKKETKAPEKKETKIPEKKETKILEKKETKIPERKETKIPERKETKIPERKESKIPERKETTAPEKKETKIPEKKETKSPEKGAPKAPEKGDSKAPQKRGTKVPQKRETKALKKETKAPKKGEAKIPEDPAEVEKNLILRFQIYESSQQNITEVFSSWDRVQGTMQLPVIQKGNKSQPSGENKGLKKTSKPQEKVKKPERECVGQRSLQSSQLGMQSEAAEGAVRDKHVGVPCLDIQVSDPKAMIREILRDGKLPTEDQMLKYLGLHPDGPPLAPAAVLSIVEYPEERLGPAERVEPFTIVAPQGAAVEDNLAKAPNVKGSSAEGQPKTGKAAGRDSSLKEKQRTEGPQDSSATRSKSILESALNPTEFLRLKRYRWVVPAHGEVKLKVHFSTKRPGKFEQTLRFELVQTKRLYELPCCGTGLYPSISQDPRLVFPQWRETMEADDIIFKEYVESTKQFHFGPLLCGKSRDWYKCQNCPRNSENITILNNSPMDVEVRFSFENAAEAATFLLDPPSMALKPKKKQKLTIWAYPTSPGFLQDKLICSIGKNPEPVVFSLCCLGVRMKLELSPLELSFDKLLLHRTDSRTLVLKNNALLPMAWQLSGLDDLAENFSLSQDNGTIDPRSELEVTVHFKAGQAGSIEESLRLEVSDTENILGIVQTENIKISAEVYDIPLSIDMPEGPDGSLEFGTINVLDNVKKVLSLKSKGVYNIEYSFMLKGAGPRMQDLASHFTVEPQSGMLTAWQSGVNIEMLFHPTSEIVLKNKPILYCQVIDGSSREGGQAVANIPVKVSARAEYSKYSIEPASPTDFGTMIKGTRKTRTLVMKNKGTVNFKFHIRQAAEGAAALESKSSKQGESAPSATELSTGRKSSSSTQGHLNLGMFRVSPYSGSIRPWGQQLITVECLARQEGTYEEQLYFDITGRDPKDNPLGIPFTLMAESYLPALEDIRLIYKDYPICSSTNLCHKLQSVKSTGLFIRDENKLIFHKVLVGQEAEAHFNIYNASRLPCDVVLSIKTLPGEEKSPIKSIFKLDPVKMSIAVSSYALVKVTFTPPDEQNYDCIVKASLIIPKCSSVGIKPKILTFTISGKGHEPQLTVVCPSARSKRGNAVLRFKRLQVGDSETLPLVVRNNGITPLEFMLCLEDKHGVFFLRRRASTLRIFRTGDVEEDSAGNESKPPKKLFFLLSCGQSTKFDVIFKPTLAQRLEEKICLIVGDICMTQIELVGEGHKDEFTLSGLEEDIQERNAESSLKKDIIDAVRVNHLQFGYCPVGKPCRRTFTITNHTRTKVMRFEWEADAPFQFSPKVIEIAPEPAHTVVEESSQELEVYLSAVVVYAQFKLNTTMVEFKDTLPFQTRTTTFRLCNTGKVSLEYSWEKAADSEAVKKPFSTDQMRHFLSATVRRYRKLLDGFRWQQEHPFKIHPSEPRRLQQPAKQQQDSKQDLQQQQQQDSKQDLQQQQQDSKQDLQQQQQDSKQDLQQQQQDSKQDLQQQQDFKQELQQEPEQQDCSKRLLYSKHVGSALEIFPDFTHGLPLFSINPCHGILAPGQKQTFHVQFSPKFMGMFETTVLCRIPNLKPAQKMGQVIVKGRAQEQKSHGEPLQQTEKGLGPKKEVFWKPIPKAHHLCQLVHPPEASTIVPSAADGLPPFTGNLCSYPSKLQ
ncbi:hydrocephalus-inducing protein homolog isoform X2 [Taeniopygia guttata]|uniref:hydrocephalus-inducing protein homolog isoform X2 n=1 Tax=Taeniopygia guttata TaxID=59729 RepID=UPI003BB8AF86